MKTLPETPPQRYDAVALFSGGLDSILAAKTIVAQGLRVKCLHFITPFFGKPAKLKHWSRIYGLDISGVDVSDAFVAMLRARPAHGFGKVMNPCVDCKILMMAEARARMARYGASFIISGEVLGQRPMSQRRDTLNVIGREGDVRDILLRPLSAKMLDPTAPERSGLVDRARLHGIYGRGRKEQLALAEYFALQEIPTPAGGCRLAEMENARRYWPVLQQASVPSGAEFRLANTGRQYWSGPHWLSIGRNNADNEYLEKCAFPEDMRLRVRDFPSPLAVARQFNPWDKSTLIDAAAFVASFSPKAVAADQEVTVLVSTGGGPEKDPQSGALVGEKILYQIVVRPCRTTPLGWAEHTWSEVRAQIRAEARDLQLAKFPQGSHIAQRLKQQSCQESPENSHAGSLLAKDYSDVIV
ncbi:MAG: tRNA(5-methylaminomethyl-2-thiouridylate) methyltransferase [Desulfovibrionaceae bacterium]